MEVIPNGAGKNIIATDVKQSTVHRRDEVPGLLTKLTYVLRIGVSYQFKRLNSNFTKFSKETGKEKTPLRIEMLKSQFFPQLFYLGIKEFRICTCVLGEIS
jgi:hypothetical protein